MKSRRADGKGHWPAAKRRHRDKGNWQRIRLSLSTFLDDHPQPGQISARALAHTLGVSDRSVRRWIKGEDRPDVDVQEAIEAWLQQSRSALRR